ncbi:hypothetical protein KVMX100_110131 [Klebsiella variicola]|nr:hypothetical protein KVMX100_110131 [Klebsiella variicola]
MPLPGVATLMPLSCCRIIAAYNRCTFGIRAALPELIVIYDPYPSLHRLAITRLGAASLLLHCLSAAVYPLITSLLYPRVGIVGDLSLIGVKVRAVSLHCFVVR